jgi:hypothetical protein
MKTRWMVMGGMAAVLMALVASSFGGARSTDPLGVAVSPQKLLLSTVQTGSVKVHTDIPIGLVDRSSLALNGVFATGSYADSLGQIVVVFDEADIKAIVSAPSTVLTLTGLYTTGEPFSGSDTVMVEEFPAL